MIYLNITGGIGNMMFIIAGGESLRQKGYDIRYPNVNWWLSKMSKEWAWEKHAMEYKQMFKNFDWDKYDTNNIEELRRENIPFKYFDFKPQDGHFYNGYFQSEKFFYNKDFVKWLFEPSDSVVKRMSDHPAVDGTTCSVHVRRGDYLKSQQYHPILDMDYYNKAIERIKADKYLVFSDDLDWCKENFKGKEFIFPSDIDYVEMYLMRDCKHHILGNSSFSLMSALLGEEEDTMVIAPKTWFGKSLPDNHADDVVPKRFIRI